jgi:hypothetical protein
MRPFIKEADRGRWTLLRECLDDFIDESNSVRVIDAFVDALDSAKMSFEAGGGAGSNWWAVVPPVDSAEALHLRLSEPGAVEPTAGPSRRNVRLTK